MAASPDDSASSKHKPVLLRETIQQLKLSPHLIVVDGTVGAGGHSQQIIKQIGDQGQLIGLDRDPMMLQFSRQKLHQNNITLRQSSYADLPEVLNELNIPGVDRILVDLGLSSDQLEHAERGFGFSTSGRLDMRFDESRGESASELINTLTRHELVQIFEDFGEEKYSSSITDAILKRRTQSPIETVQDLNHVVESAIPETVLRQSDKHPATRVYQALRIAVNNELQHVQDALTQTFPDCLNLNGILVVITFHSLEDRLVKRAFQDQRQWENLTTKPITPRPNEQKMNPRSRSAKLRAAKLISKNPQN
ncbi:MAG: 16S rRNA (cytosine(1402)-N(4))-methyltransferase RsmH [Planctomycetaceae bacterium]|jgi:16S rRNA (cytosine1402-N4)-methyltransferase|nr:16S rRNA (cytosine(1402)-N(4))-methyltransferase RsmH [Planctomycetaceae bacterium]